MPLERVFIRGRGPTALTLALLLRRQGLEPARVGLDPHRGAPPADLAARALALSDGSWQILGRVARPPDGGAIDSVDIAFAGHGAHLRLTATEAGVRSLGRVVRHGALAGALEHALGDWPAAMPPAADNDDCLVVHAEGSFEESLQMHEFGQHALFTELVIDEHARSGPQRGVAYERFAAAGPIALLPLPEPGRLSLVWCDLSARIGTLLTLPAADFEEALSAALGGEFGQPPRLAGARHAVPLRSAAAAPDADAGVRIGNAAQTLHPVAGQGLNLGLRDAFTLAETIGDAMMSGASVRAVVSRFETVRGPDRRVTLGLTNRLAELGNRPRAVSSLAPAAGSILMGLLDLVGPVRRRVSRHFVYGLR